jgi:hypothetical protein
VRVVDRGTKAAAATTTTRTTTGQCLCPSKEEAISMGASVLPAEFQRRRAQCCSLEAVSHSRYAPTDPLVLPRAYNQRKQVLQVPHTNPGELSTAQQAPVAGGGHWRLRAFEQRMHMWAWWFPKGSWNGRTDGLTQARARSRTVQWLAKTHIQGGQDSHFTHSEKNSLVGRKTSNLANIQNATETVMLSRKRTLTFSLIYCTEPPNSRRLRRICKIVTDHLM